MTPDIGLGNWMFQRALRTPHRAALTFEGTTWTYGQLQDRIDRLAGALRAEGVCQGDRVGFLGLNQPAFLETLFAAARLGAIFVPLNFRLTGAELRYIIGDAGVHTLIADAPHRPVIDPIRAELPCRRCFSADQAAEGWPAIAGADRGARADQDRQGGSRGRRRGHHVHQRNDRAAQGCDADARQHLVEQRQRDACLRRQGERHLPAGGAAVSHRRAQRLFADHLAKRRPYRFAPELRPRAVPGRHRRGIGSTTLFGVPAMLLFISQQPAFATADLSSLDNIVCGGAPVPEPLLRLYAERGVPINQGYGMTEAAPFVTFLAPEWGMAKLGSAGRTPLFCEMRLVDADGRDIEATARQW